MHKYRSQAKRLAWYDDNEDGGPSYNPFRKYRPNRGGTSHDAEDGENYLQRSHTEPNRTAEDRSESTAHTGHRWRVTDPRRSKVSRADSAPPSPRTASPSSQNRPASPDAAPAHDPKLDSDGSPAQEKDDVDISEFSVSVEPIHEHSQVYHPVLSETKTRRRKLPAFLKKSAKEDDRLDDSETKRRPHFTAASQIRATLFNSWLNVMFVFVPAGFAVYYAHLTPVVVFTINFLAIFPSGMMLAYALEEVMMRLGETLGGLLSMTFSNAVQLISSILLLKARQIPVLQSSLLGSILANLLLTMGLAFFVGGINRVEQYYNVNVAQTVCMLLLLAVLSIVIPTCSRLLANASPSGILAQSRGTAVIIIISYFLWLFFQLKTHRQMLSAPVPKAPKKPSIKRVRGDASKGIAKAGGAFAASTFPPTRIPEEGAEEEDEEEEPQLSLWVAWFTLLFSTVLVAFNTEFATNSIQGLLQRVGLSQTFFGLVIIPLLSLEPTSIVAAKKDKMHLTVALTLERCMQTALMVVPLTVLLGWCMSVDDMTLQFDGFSIAALFASIIIVAHVVQEGKSNWLTGALLIKVYLIIGLASYFIHIK